MGELLSAHFGEILTALCTVGLAVVTAYGAIKVAVAIIETKQVAETKARETFQQWEMEARLKLESDLKESHNDLKATVVRHVENPDIHFHRRETDLTGLWPKMGG